MPVANARMYTLGPTTADAWRALIDWVGARAEVALETVEHEGPLFELWRRNDLGCALMCGYPWATWRNADGARPLPLAAPVPAPPEFAAQPRYRTDIVVRADSAFKTLADLRGKRFAYTTDHSQSGYQAARALFVPLARASGNRVFATTVGPLVTPCRVVEAILSDGADAGPLDGWWHALLHRHEPAIANRLRVIAVTPWTALPFFVAAAAIDASVRERIARALLAVGAAQAMKHARNALLLRGFAPVDRGRYVALANAAHAADAAGYPRLQ